jgi:hypothetical protein
MLIFNPSDVIAVLGRMGPAEDGDSSSGLRRIDKCCPQSY